MVDFKRLVKLSNELPVLVYLAFRGATRRWVTLSSRALGEELGFSQQTASRRLQKLEREGLIERQVTRRYEKVKLTDSAIDMLRDLYYTLSVIVPPKVTETLTIEGIVFSGLGEGRYYMSLEGYVKQIEEKLGFKPYPGTLNIRLVEKSEILKRLKLEEYPPILIAGFSNGKRTYGSVKAYKASINGFKPAAVVIPSRTSYGIDVLEVIAPVMLREKLNLRDGDVVKVTIYLQ